MAPFFGSYSWFRPRKSSETLSIHDGLFQIGCQAYHILVRDPGDPPDPPGLLRTPATPTSDQVVVLIPSVKPTSVKGRLSQMLDRGPSLPSDDYDDWESRYMMRSDLDDFGDKHSEVERLGLLNWGMITVHVKIYHTIVYTNFQVYMQEKRWGQKGWFKPSCVPISIILILIVLVVLLPLLDHADRQAQAAIQMDYRQLRACQDTCKFSLVESIPDGMSYRNGTTPYPTTYSVWLDMLAKAKSTVEIASFYWTLRDGTAGKFPTGEQGQKVFDELLAAGTKRKLTLKIAQNQPSKSEPSTDTVVLAQEGAAEVRSLNFERLVGGGVLHTKFWMVDRKHVYIGSANTDWRSLAQVKEMGVYIQDCPCVVQDAAKIFEVYWELGVPGAVVPKTWPSSLSTAYNKDSPMNLSSIGQLYFSSSPPVFCPSGRTDDGTAITTIIGEANKFVYISVMDYLPLYIYTAKIRWQYGVAFILLFLTGVRSADQSKFVDFCSAQIKLYSNQYWDVIDSAIRSAAIDNGAEVRLLIGWWKHSRDYEKQYLRSLVDISNQKDINISVKLFVVPSSAEQSKIPYARVNHAKFMVTDNTAYIGTSNWSADYFTDTGGVGVVVKGDTELRQQLEDVFLRDWNSEFAYDLPR